MRRLRFGLGLLCLSLLTLGVRAQTTRPAIRAAQPPSYTVAEVAGPKNVELEVGGMDWMPDGRLAVCIRRGDVWTFAKGNWKLFASGLQEPLGVMRGTGDNDLYVMQRPELTHLVDTHGTGAADLYQTVNMNFGFSGNYHEFAYGPAVDREGYVYFSLNLAHNPDAFGAAFMGAHVETPYRGWVFKSVTPGAKDGKFEPFAYGFRSPNGLAANPAGDIFFTDNQGEWIAACWLGQIKEDRFYGNPSSMIFTKDWNHRDPKTVTVEELDRKRTPPAVLFPYGRMGQSLSQPIWDTTGGKFGPYEGQCFVGDVQIPLVMRATLEKVDGEYQGACYPFVRDPILQGANRLLFDPSNGSLLVGRTDRGWIQGAYGITRITYSGVLPFDILKMSLTPRGFDLQFTKPVDAKKAADPQTYSLLHWHMIYHKDYGSPEVDKTAVKIQQAIVSGDGRHVALILPELLVGKIYDLTLEGLNAADGSELINNHAYYTLNHLIK
jgi:glucose/arabinose dehydrogenase